MAHPVAFFKANPAAGVDELQSNHAGAFYSLSSSPPPAKRALAATVAIVITCVLVVISGSLANPKFLISSGLELPSISVPISSSRASALGRVVDFGKQRGLLGPLSQCFQAADFGDARVIVAPMLSASIIPDSIGDLVNAGLVQWLRWEQVSELASGTFCASAHFILSTMGSRATPWATSLPTPSEIDWGPVLSPLAIADANAWERSVALSEQTDRSLLASFAAVPRSDPHYEYLAGCASRVLADTAPSLLDVPLHLRTLGDRNDHPDYASLPFTNRFTPQATERLPQAKQSRSTSFRPLSFEDILEPGAIAAIQHWLYVEGSNMLAMAKHGAKVERIRNAIAVCGFGEAVEPHEVLVIGQDQFLEKARGIIWDCRGFEHGLAAVPMDFSSAPSSQLNSDFVESALASWPDQEMVGMLTGGVQFKANLPLQFVFGPHLTSLPVAYSNVQVELLRLCGLGYYNLHRVLPFAPMRAMPQGSTPRKLEPGRDRRTTDAGFPRSPVTDRAGVLARSLNAAIALKAWVLPGPLASPPVDDVPLDAPQDGAPPVDDPSVREQEFHRSEAPDGSVPKWLASEIKPQVQDKAWDDSILRHAAFHAFHDPLLGWTDDIADYFNHLPLATSEWWVSCLFWAFGQDGNLQGFASPFSSPITVVSEKVLGFGVSLSPNVAQRFAEAIVATFRSRFDEEEELLFAQLLDPVSHQCAPYNVLDALTTSGDGWTDVCRWIHERRRLTALTGRNQLRRYAVHIYTDDPVFTVVGSDVLLRAMRCWHSTTVDFGLRMAIARKRQVGNRLQWLGFNFYLTSGLITVAPDKVSRARAMVEQILDGGVVCFDQYRRLLGLLEHLLVFVGGDRTFMYGLYGWNFHRGLTFGPATRMVFRAVHTVAFRRWLSILMSKAGCYFSIALASPTVPVPALPVELYESTLFAPRPLSEDTFYLYSDAAVEVNEGGLGGWAHGLYWCFPLDEFDRTLLHITAWEFVALAINIIVFGAVLAGHRVILLADALASVQIMVNRAAHSPVMQIIHRLILALPEMGALGANLLEEHVFGELNVLADAASRARRELIQTIATQMGLMARELPLPVRALEFIAQVRKEVRELHLERDPPNPRPPTRAELELSQHRGLAFSTAEDSPIRYGPPWFPRPESPPLLVPHGPCVQLPGISVLVRPCSDSPPLLEPHGPSFQLCDGPRLQLSRMTVEAKAVPQMSSGSPSHTEPGQASAKRPRRMLGEMTQAQPPVPSSHTLINEVIDHPPATAPSPLVVLLRNDNSKQALRPDDPSLLEAYAQAVSHTQHHSAPASTQAANKTGMRLWTEFTGIFNTAALRDDLPGPGDSLDTFSARERFLKGAFILWARRHPQVRSTIPGRSTVKPSTLIGHLQAVKRVHVAQGRMNFLRPGETKSIVRYLQTEYGLVHTFEALAPRRREGFSRQMVCRLLEALPGCLLSSRSHPVIVDKSWLYYNLRACIAVSASGGFRKAEISLPAGTAFNAMHMSRASLFFIINKQVVRAPSRGALQRMREGDKVGLLAVPCKNDPLGLHFVPFPLIFPFHPADNRDTGVILRDLALHCWVAPRELRATPMFTYEADSRFVNRKPITRDFLDLTLRALLRSWLNEDVACLYSWHSFRIGLACALKAAGAPDPIILALCRWRSKESIPTYGRINHEMSCGWLDAAASQDISSIQTPNIGSIPSVLPPETYNYLAAALALERNLTPEEIRGLTGLLPQLDDDDFMRDLASAPIVGGAESEDDA